jgi:catechol 2,3-dioxygenase-like lactoylglutathione lyase family enzyme
VVEITRPNVDICIICHDLDKSLHFYQEIMGFEIALDVFVTDEIATKAGLAPKGFRQVRLNAGKTLIKLVGIDPTPGPRTHEFAAGVRWLTFFIEDMAGTYERMKEQGVTFLGEPFSAMEAAGVACALDPDGILIEMVELRE